MFLFGKATRVAQNDQWYYALAKRSAERPYANPDFAKSEADEAKPCLRPTESGEFGFAPP